MVKYHRVLPPIPCLRSRYATLELPDQSLVCKGHVQTTGTSRLWWKYNSHQKWTTLCDGICTCKECHICSLHVLRLGIPSLGTYAFMATETGALQRPCHCGAARVSITTALFFCIFTILGTYIYICTCFTWLPFCQLDFLLPTTIYLYEILARWNPYLYPRYAWAHRWTSNYTLLQSLEYKNILLSFNCHKISFRGKGGVFGGSTINQEIKISTLHNASKIHQCKPEPHNNWHIHICTHNLKPYVCFWHNIFRPTCDLLSQF